MAHPLFFICTSSYAKLGFPSIVIHNLFRDWPYPLLIWHNMPTMPDILLKVGDKAPSFSLPTHQGQKVSLSDFLGKQPVILIFYPGDMTPGCTIQLCSIRDDWAKFKQAKTAVFGVNHADAESHNRFADKYSFPFPLLVDKDKKVSRKYGAVKKIFTATVIRRTVVIVGKDGLIKFHRHGMPKDAEILKALKKN